MHGEKAVNRHIRNLGQSVTFALNEHCKQLEAGGKNVFRLGLGQSPFPVPEHVVEALRHHARERLYQPVQGIPSLRRAVAQFHNMSDDLSLDAEHVMIGPGSKELLFLLQLAFNGEIIIPTPSWVSYAPQAKIIGHKIRFVHTSFKNRWHMQPAQLERLIQRSRHPKKPRLLILNSPGNPCGLSYSSDELKALADIAREHRIIILSDEIYGHLHHQANHVSIARHFPEGTIISSGISKWCGAGGWRLGTFAFPPQLDWLMQAMSSVASETYSSVCAPVQYAAVEAFRFNSETITYLHNARRILSTVGNECAYVLQRAGIDVHPPEGGFYLFPDFSNVMKDRNRTYASSTEFANSLLDDTGVAVIPGSAFNRKPKELTARLAYVNFDGEAALEAAKAIPEDEPLPESFTKKYSYKTLEAMSRIAAWVR